MSVTLVSERRPHALPLPSEDPPIRRQPTWRDLSEQRSELAREHTPRQFGASRRGGTAASSEASLLASTHRANSAPADVAGPQRAAKRACSRAHTAPIRRQPTWRDRSEQRSELAREHTPRQFGASRRGGTAASSEASLLASTHRANSAPADVAGPQRAAKRACSRAHTAPIRRQPTWRDRSEQRSELAREHTPRRFGASRRAGPQRAPCRALRS